MLEGNRLTWSQIPRLSWSLGACIPQGACIKLEICIGVDMWNQESSTKSVNN